MAVMGEVAEVRPNGVVVVQTKRRRFTDWRLWLAICATMAFVALGIALVVTGGVANSAGKRLDANQQESRCYRAAVAETTRAAAEVNVDLADFVAAALKLPSGSPERTAFIDEFVPRIEANSTALKNAIEAQLSAVDTCSTTG